MDRLRRYRAFIMDSTRWDAYEPRDGDIVVTTPPKCGTTWMQMCSLLLVHKTPTLPAPLSMLSPWFDQTLTPIDEVVARLDGQQHRRVIKTHTPLDGVPLYDSVTYVVVGRDPRDVALSFANHLTNFDLDAAKRARGDAEPVSGPSFLDRPTDPVGLFSWFVDDDSPVEEFTTSLRFVTHHLGQAWARRGEPNVELFHYGAMKRDLDSEMRCLADILGIAVGPGWDDLVHAATFESMKDRADVLAPNAQHGVWRDNREFFAQGRHGAWRDAIPAEALERYDTKLHELCPPELAAWLHGL